MQAAYNWGRLMELDLGDEFRLKHISGGKFRFLNPSGEIIGSCVVTPGTGSLAPAIKMRDVLIDRRYQQQNLGMRAAAALQTVSKNKLNSPISVEAKEKKKKRRRGFFAALYGDDKGHSGATIPAFASLRASGVKSGAFPGPGGINGPNVPGGANSGMGPAGFAGQAGGTGGVGLASSKDPLGMKDFEALLFELAAK